MNGNELDTQEELVLYGLKDGKSYEEIGAYMDRSKAWISKLVMILEEEGFITRVKYKHRSTELTDKAIKYLARKKAKNAPRTNA